MVLMNITYLQLTAYGGYISWVIMKKRGLQHVTPLQHVQCSCQSTDFCVTNKKPHTIESQSLSTAEQQCCVDQTAHTEMKKAV